MAKRKTHDELIAEHMATIARLEAKRDARLQRESMRKEEERRREEQRSKESRLHTRWNSTDRTLTPNDYWVLEMMHAQLERAIQIHRRMPLTSEEIHKVGRLVSTHLFEFSVIYSGMASKDILRQRYAAWLKGHDAPSWCNEHMIPRGFAGDELVRHFLNHNRISRKELLSEVMKYAHVHRVSSQENQRIKVDQRSDVFTTWQDVYQKHGIELVEWPAGAYIRNLPTIYPDLTVDLT